MAYVQNSAIYPQSINASPPVLIVSSAATTIFTAGTNGSVVFAINCTLADGTARTATLTLVRGGVTIVLIVTQLPISAGQITGTAPVNLIARAILPGVPFDQSSNPAMIVYAGDVFQLAVASLSVSCSVNVQAWDY